VADLIHDIGDAMQNEGVSYDYIQTNVGWVYFWSDTFPSCFVKQKENSVWILTVNICPPVKEMNSGYYYIHVMALGFILGITQLS
jgi:hypothetical protein